MPAEAASSFYSDALTWPPCLLTGYGAPIFVPEGFYLYLVDWQRHKELEESHSRKEAFRVLAVAASVSLVRLHALAKLTEWAVGLALSSRDALTLSQRWIAWWFRYFKKGAASWRDREFIGPKDMHDSVHRSTTRKKIVPRTMHEFTESDPPPPRLVDRNRMLWVRKFKCQVPAEGVHRVSAVQQKLVWIYCIARADGAGRDWWVSEAAYNNLSEHQIEPQVSNSPASGSPPAAARPVRLTRQERIAEDEARRNERFEALAVAHAAENETLKLEMATIREEMADLKRQNAALQAEVTSLKRHRRNPEEKAGSEMPAPRPFASNEQIAPLPLPPTLTTDSPVDDLDLTDMLTTDAPVGDFGLTNKELDALLASF